MVARFPLLAPLVALSISLAGCTRDQNVYPSLAPRAVEKLGFAEPEIPAVAVAPDPALDAKVATHRRTLAELKAGFDEATAIAEGAARRAKGQAVGTEAWLDAQAQLAILDDKRAQTSSLVTDIDRMIADRAAMLAPVFAPLADLRDAAVAESTREGRAITRLEAMVATA